MKQPLAGFTLIELLVAIVVVGILGAVGAPAMSDFFRSSQQAAAFSQLVNMYNFARQEAIYQNASVHICPVAEPNINQCTANWSDGLMVFLNNTGDNLYQPGDTRLRVADFADSIMLINSRRGDFIITIDANGAAGGDDNSTFTMSMVGTAEEMRMVISVPGRARIETVKKE